MPKVTYARVIGSPAIEICSDWRDSFFSARSEALQIAKSNGFLGFGLPRYSGRVSVLCGRADGSDPGPSWKVARASSHNEYSPRAGTKGKDAQAVMASMPVFPTNGELSTALGIPEDISYKLGGTTGSYGMGGMAWDKVGMHYMTPSLMIIWLPDVPAEIKQCRIRNPGCEVFLSGVPAAEWTLPAGLEILTENEKELAIARDKVARADAGGLAT